MNDTLTVALLREVFPEPGDAPRLANRLQEAADGGAGLVLLPELPLNGWAASTKDAREEDAEGPDGPRRRRLQDAAAAVGIAVLGGVILRSQQDGRRRNTALLVAPDGQVIAEYAKVHLPQEPGYWETSHYEPGLAAPAPVRLPGLPGALGVQICSDLNRPAGVQLLATRGADVVLHPRATEPGTWHRWRLVMRATALANAVWLLSVNRPDQPDVPIGGPSVVVDPQGEVILETEAALSLATIDLGAVRHGRTTYPGYLAGCPDIYAAGWAAAAGAGQSLPA